MAPYDVDASSNHIVNLIRILLFNKDDADSYRDRLKRESEVKLETCNEKLNKLVVDHHKDLRAVMQTFTRISNNLQSSLTKLTRAKVRLVDAREMLTSRLEELRRLNDELRVSERMVALLDQADSLTNADTKQDRPKDQTDDSPIEGLTGPSYIDNNVFNPRANNETSTPSLFKFSKSSYAICFEEHNKDMSF